jgi:hypothetical protein
MNPQDGTIHLSMQAHNRSPPLLQDDDRKSVLSLQAASLHRLDGKPLARVASGSARHPPGFFHALLTPSLDYQVRRGLRHA